MKLNRPQFAWLLYDPGNAAYALIVRTVFAPLFFKYCVADHFSEAESTGIWGYIASFSGIAAGIIAPGLGAFADSRRIKKFLLAFFVLTGVATTAALGFVGRGSDKVVIALSFASLASYMIANSFYDALLTDVSPRGKRDGLSSLAYAWGYVGGVLPFILCLGAVKFFDLEQLAAARFAFILSGVWWTLLTLPLLFCVKERPHREERKHTIGEICRRIFGNRNVLIFLAAYFLYIDGVGTIYLLATPIASDIGISTTLILVTVLALQFLAFPFTIGYGKLARRFPVRRVIWLAIGVYMVISLLAGTLPLLPTTRAKVIVFWILAGLIGTSQGGIQALSRSLYSRLIPAENAAEFFGIYNLFGKFTTIMGPLLVGLSIGISGRSEYGISMLVVLFGAGAFLLGRVRIPEGSGKTGGADGGVSR